MRTTKTRHQFYLPDALSVKLDALAEGAGGSKSAPSLTRSPLGSSEVQLPRSTSISAHGLTGLSKVQAQVEDKVDILSETLAAFIRHQVTLAAHQPTFDAATRQFGMAGTMR